MFRRAHHAGVERVEIHIEWVGNIARHHRPLEKMDVVQPIHDARCVINVLQQRFAVFAFFDVDEMHGGTGGTVMDALALDHHVVLWVLPAQGEVARRIPDRRHDQFAWKAQAAVFAQYHADPGAGFDAAWDCVGETHSFKQRQHRLVDSLEITLAQRLVPAALQSRPDRPHVVGQRRRPHSATRLASARTPRTAVLAAHILADILLFHGARHADAPHLRSRYGWFNPADLTASVPHFRETMQRPLPACMGHATPPDGPALCVFCGSARCASFEARPHIGT
jgi:hypothetical protein